MCSIGHHDHAVSIPPPKSADSAPPAPVPFYEDPNWEPVPLDEQQLPAYRFKRAGLPDSRDLHYSSSREK